MLQLNLLAPHIDMLKQVFMSRKATLCDALREFCPECTFVEPAGGYFVWVQLPHGVDAELLLTEASTRHGVAFTPGSRCSLGAPAPRTGAVPRAVHVEAAKGETEVELQAAGSAMMSRCARLSFAFYRDDEIRVGVERLSSALRVILSASRG